MLIEHSEGGGWSPFHSSIRTKLGQDLNENFYIKVYQYFSKWKVKFICFNIKKVSEHVVIKYKDVSLHVLI